MPGKRRFGRVRRLPSGRYQVRYRGPDGIDRPAPETFRTKGDAEVWLTMKEAVIRRHYNKRALAFFGATPEVT